jgi:hypothetical protein
VTVVHDEDRRAGRDEAVFASDTVLIVAAGLAFALAMLGWLAGHRISLALPPEVATRAMVPLMVGVAGLFLGVGLGLLLGELRRPAGPRGVGRHVDNNGGRHVNNDTGSQLVGGLRSMRPAAFALGVGVILLLATAWMVKPAESAEAPASPATTGTAPAVETGTVSPTALPTATTR